MQTIRGTRLSTTDMLSIYEIQSKRLGFVIDNLVASFCCHQNENSECILARRLLDWTGNVNSSVQICSSGVSSVWMLEILN
jgi:hypothetical protein